MNIVTIKRSTIFFYLSHLPSVTETSSNDTSISFRFGAVARNKIIKKSSIFLKVIWALIQVVERGELFKTSTFPGLPFIGHASTCKAALPPPGKYFLYRNDKQATPLSLDFGGGIILLK